MAAARYVLLVLGLVLILAGMVGGLTGKYQVAPNCTARLPFTQVWYQGNVYDSATGANLGGVYVQVWDMTQKNVSLTALAADTTGYYSKIIKTPTQYGCDEIAMSFTLSGYAPIWALYYLPSNICDPTLPAPACYGYTAIQDMAMVKQVALTSKFTYATSSLLVSFTDTSLGNPSSWSWTFGDGGSSTSQNPQHAYAAAGTYAVQLTVLRASDGAKSVTGATITLTSTTSGSGGSTNPAPPVFPPGPAPPRTNTTGQPPPSAVGAPIAPAGSVSVWGITLTPSPVVVVLVLVGAFLVVIAAAWKT